MIKKNLILKIIIIIILLILGSVNIPALKLVNLHSVHNDLYINDVKAPEGVELILSFYDTSAYDPRTVRGYVYVDGVITTPDEVKLVISDQQIIAYIPGDPVGYYLMDFDEDVGASGVFYVTLLGGTWEAAETITIKQGVYFYKINLTIDTSNPSLNSPPYKPENPNPQNNSESINLNPTLSVLVIDPDDDTMNVSFFDASDDSLIDIAYNILNDSSASVEWQDLSYNTTYFWYAVANDSEFETRSDTWNFRTIQELVNNPPNKPIDPIPENNSVDVSFNPTLSVNVSDPDGDTMNVSFFDASDDSLIDTDTNVPNGGTASIVWSELSSNTTYFWYAIANDSEFETKSDTWQFTTAENNPPEKPDAPIPANNSVNIDLNPTLRVFVIDIDDDSMDVSFYDASDDSLIDTVSNVENASTASIVWSDLSYSTTYFWYAVANDSEFETRSDTWQFTTKINKPPVKPTDPDPENNQQEVGLNPTLSVLVIDPDNDLLTVEFYNASDDMLIGTDSNVESGTRASVEWADLSYNTDYSWYVIVNDSIDFTKSDTWSFKTVENINPTVRIVKPERGLYILNRKILPRIIRLTLIIGRITIEAEANDDDGSIEKVEFYINGKLKETDNFAPYSYDWRRDRLRLFHIFSIKVVAYDDGGATAAQQMIVKKYL